VAGLPTPTYHKRRQMLVMANSTTEAFFLINSEMRAIRQAVLQNRMALDLLLSHEGGVCQVLNTSCCFSIPDYYENITDLVSHMKQTQDWSYLQLSEMMSFQYSMRDTKEWPSVESRHANLCGGLALASN
uniref:Uncharacterized protein n=1 Tax=Astyanax mexicanus TaxID=7994 RepID=A0A8B9HI07_ASTMX